MSREQELRKEFDIPEDQNLNMFDRILLWAASEEKRTKATGNNEIKS